MRVEFERPNVELLRQQQYTLVDLHFHTRYSDGINSIPAVVARAKRLNIGIAITDHNAIQGAVDIARHTTLLTIPGIEVTEKSGAHVLIYFYDIPSIKSFYAKHIEPNMGHDVMSPTSLVMEDLIARARQYRCVIIFPHPYSAAYTGICNVQFSKERLTRLLEQVDGIEAINAENTHRWNLKSTILAFNAGKGITGGSDGHTLYHMGKVITYAACPPQREAFLEAIKTSKTFVVGKEIDLLRKATSNSLKLRRTLKNYPDIFEKNVRFSYTLLNHKAKTLKKQLMLKR